MSGSEQSGGHVAPGPGPVFAEDVDLGLAERVSAVGPDWAFEDAEIERVLGELGFNEWVERRLAERRAELGLTEPGQEKVLEVLRVVLSRLIDPPRGSNIGLEAEIVGLAIGHPGLGSMARVGRRNGLSKAAVSKRALGLVNQFNLPPSVYMKSAKARAGYRETNTKRRAGQTIR